MPRRMNLLGQTFGRLAVTARVGSDSHGAALWHCLCACGRSAIARTSALRSGNTTSCGCKGPETRRTHAMSKTPEYTAWVQARQRCRNPKWPAFHRYGGRGITICDRWNDFRAFYADMGPRPSPAHSLDRINNDGPYAPENCRWATVRAQNYNKGANRIIDHDGERLPLNAWAERAGINKSTFYYRLRRGMPMREALFPVHRRQSAKAS